MKCLSCREEFEEMGICTTCYPDLVELKKKWVEAERKRILEKIRSLPILITANGHKFRAFPLAYDVEKLLEG